MKYTFGICSNVLGIESCAHTIKSIVDLHIPNYEILVVGGMLEPLQQWIDDAKFDDIIRIIDFDETQRQKGWITKKKNIITEEAQYENIVYLHDYFLFQPMWYDHWELFGDNWDIAVNRILNPNSSRHSDWVIDSYLMWSLFPETKDSYDVLLPYEYKGLTKIQYISGGYWLGKKEFMQRFPLDENLVWGQAEDIYWSRIVRENTEFKMNTKSVVKLSKSGKWEPKLINEEVLKKMTDHFKLEISYE